MKETEADVNLPSISIFYFAAKCVSNWIFSADHHPAPIYLFASAVVEQHLAVEIAPLRNFSYQHPVLVGLRQVVDNFDPAHFSLQAIINRSARWAAFPGTLPVRFLPHRQQC